MVIFPAEIEANVKAGSGGGSGPSRQKDAPRRHYQRPPACCWNPSNFVITPGSLSPGGRTKTEFTLLFFFLKGRSIPFI